MVKLVLDPEESGIELAAKLFFTATRNLGISDKDASDGLKNTVEFLEEHSGDDEVCGWYKSAKKPVEGSGE